MNNNINILVNATLDKNTSKNNINSALASLKINKLKLEAAVDIDETKKNIAAAIEKSKIRQIKLLGKLDIAKTRANINAQLQQFRLENQITLSTNIKANTAQVTSTIDKAVASVQEKVKSKNVTITPKVDISQIKSVQAEIKKISALNSFQTWWNRNSRAHSNDALTAGYEKLRQDLSAVGVSATEASLRIRAFKNTVKAAGYEGQSLGSVLGNAVSKFSQWGIASTLVVQGIHAIRGIIQNVVELDSAMVELKKVTDETAYTYDRFLDRASEKAIALGSSLIDLVNSTADFARLGYSLQDAEQLAQTATIYQNVGDDIADIDQASSSIISTMKAFNIAAEDSMTIVDKFNAVSNKFAISAGGIGEALMRSASSFAAANNTLDESIALIVAANNVIQDPDVVGTMWKTVSMRIRGAKTELEEAGLEVDGMAESTSDLRDKIKALTGGFDIMLNENTFKSTYDIILGIAQVYDSLSDINQAALLELLAGKRQGNALAAALTNMADAEKVVETSVNSANSAMEEHSRWLDSIDAKTAQFQATFQKFSTTMLSSDVVKGVVDFGRGFLGTLTAIVDTLGSIPTLIAGISTGVSFKNIGILNVKYALPYLHGMVA